MKDTIMNAFNQSHVEFKAMLSAINDTILETTHRDCFHYAIVRDKCNDSYVFYTHVIEDNLTDALYTSKLDYAFKRYVEQLQCDFVEQLSA